MSDLVSEGQEPLNEFAHRHIQAASMSADDHCMSGGGAEAILTHWDQRKRVGIQHSRHCP